MQHKCKTKLLLFVFTIFLNIANAQIKTQYDQLVYINKEWKTQIDVASSLKQTKAKPLTEQQLIQLHLSETEQLLRSRSTAHLTNAQKQNRLKNLDVLHSYMLKGEFPTNTNHVNRQPYFIDEKNVYCAAGYLMQQSGYDKLARDINKTQNYSYLKDINHPLLLEWVKKSGLSVDELALIQPGYVGDAAAHIVEFHYNNTGTDVNEYIEVEQKHTFFPGVINFDRILFFDGNQAQYKTLMIGNMQSFNNNGISYFHYVFPTNENFSDIGSIELWGTGPAGLQIIERTSYNQTTITSQDFSPPNPGTINFNIAESESTPIGNSITYCGGYKSISWNASVLPATIALANPCLITAINLKDFSYTIAAKTVVLNWQVEPIAKNKQFVIERSSDGNIYSAIGAINANASQANYTFIDKNPAYINHYRLKLVETDNKFTYSKVLYSKVEEASKLILLQNIVTDKLKYQISSNNAKNIVVFNIHGQQVYSSIAKQGNATINTASWSKGKYIIRLFTATGEFFTQQFQKL